MREGLAEGETGARPNGSDEYVAVLDRDERPRSAKESL
jgi:hypothetical protein